MKTQIVNSIPKAATLLLIISLSLAACRKEQNLIPGNAPNPLNGGWKLSDETSVNNEDGKPRTGAVSSPDLAQFYLAPQGQFSAASGTGVVIKGSWSATGSQLNLDNMDGTHFSPQIASLKADTLLLMSSYDAANGFASGAVYRTYVRH